MMFSGKQQLKVREHKLLGPYVDGLQQLVASSAEDVQELMSEGSKSRTVAATKMNAESSRSHAVFTLIVTHTMTDTQTGVSAFFYHKRQRTSAMTNFVLRELEISVAYWSRDLRFVCC